MGTLATDLLRLDAYPDRPSAVALVETHISWVFLLDRDVYKVKKPVDFGFLDFRTLEQRRTACEAELALNRRLARDVYLDLTPICRGSDGAHRVGGGGEVVDYAVHMRRLPDAERGDRMLAEGRLTPAAVESLAGALAAFHARADATAAVSRFGEPEAVLANVRENFAQTAQAIGAFLSPAEAAELERFQLGFLEQHADLFRARIAAGRVRDGHGDLRLEHTYFAPDGEIRVIDCIEFNQRFRYADVCADAAFLAMDLAAHGRVDLAELFLARYAREADDFDLYALVDFYESYRAFVRAKIATFLAREAPEREASSARHHFLLALSANRSALLRPELVCVGGLIASGKSTLAERVGQRLGAPVVEADRTRKAMLGVAPTERVHLPAWQGAYDPGFSERVYAELFRRAEVVLASGRPVVIDASFRSRALRDRARRLAETQGVPFRFVECVAPEALCRARLRERERTVAVSDGRIAIFDDFCARFEPVREIDPREHLVVDTTRPIEASLAELGSQLGALPEGLVA